MKIIIDEIKRPFKTFSLSFELVYDVYNNTAKMLINDIILDFKPTKCNYLALELNDNKIEFDSQKAIFKNDIFTSVEIPILNVEIFHKKMLSFLNSSKFYRALHCYNTPNFCNLKCSYCSEGKEKTMHSLDWLPVIDVLKKEQKINKEIIHNYKSSNRIMGGETCISKNNFFHTVKIAQKTTDSLNEIMFYTNGTIPQSIENFYKFFTSKKCKFKKASIWISIDSLNINKSKRIKNQKTMDSFMNNLIFSKKISNNPNIKVNFNIMYLNLKDTKETIMFLKNHKFKYFKIATDETNKNELYHNNFRVKHYNKIHNLGLRYMQDGKYHSYDLLTYKFTIKEFGHSIYTDKISFFMNDNISRIFDFNKII